MVTIDLEDALSAVGDRVVDALQALPAPAVQDPAHDRLLAAVLRIVMPDDVQRASPAFYALHPDPRVARVIVGLAQVGIRACGQIAGGLNDQARAEAMTLRTLALAVDNAKRSIE
ncbi:MAG: hypothetical protein JNM79_01670 [Burkholderiales bacterium]|nr:hypothetical protein [Burkholderiales bacterium]